MHCLMTSYLWVEMKQNVDVQIIKYAGCCSCDLSSKTELQFAFLLQTVTATKFKNRT